MRTGESVHGQARSLQKKEAAAMLVARYAAGLTYEDLEEATVSRARQVVLDTLGTILRGYRSRIGQLCAEYAATLQPGKEASIIGDGRRSMAEAAAWANATMSNHIEMQDTHRVCGHVASEVVPVALAVGEQRGLSGRQVITALAAGYEVFGAIQPAVRASQRRRGLDHKGQVGSIASAITAGLAMGFGVEKMHAALTLAVELACGTEQYVYDPGKCDTKDLVAGFGARNGIFAAKLADIGFHGAPGALDGRYGYFHSFGDGYHSSYVENIGKHRTLATTGFKPHTGCRCVHPCVDATLELLKQGRPVLDDIERIEVGTYNDAITPDFRVNYDPENTDAASNSLPVTVAAVLALGNWYPEDIGAFADPEIKRLWPLVTVHMDEEIERAYPEKVGCVVRVVTHQGACYESRVEQAKGEPDNMMTDGELEGKLRRLAGDLLPPKRVNQILEIVWRLEELEDVGELVRLTARRKNALR